LEAGAAGLGFVNSLFNEDMILKKNYFSIRKQAEAIIKRLNSFCEDDT